MFGPDHDDFIRACHAPGQIRPGCPPEDATRLVPPATLLETALAIETPKVNSLIQRAKIVLVAVDAEHVSEARRAYRRFGKGRYAAGLNFGDVFAYALARTSGEPLLFKGDDFAKTDIGRVA